MIMALAAEGYPSPVSQAADTGCRTWHLSRPGESGHPPAEMQDKCGGIQQNPSKQRQLPPVRPT
jgi:hypothetical protein